ncbi:MAG: isoleucine--tRNA ligase, partial [Desulfobacteraceae bacterium]
NELTEKSLAAYDTFEFHIIYHALYNYCTLDLSAFYLDILKDRLYTSAPGSAERKSAQTVLHAVLDSIARIMAPILPFTADEIWKYMPMIKGKEESIHIALLPVSIKERKDDRLAGRWKKILEVRGEVTKALEEARIKKLIGHSLDASVTLAAESDLITLLEDYSGELRSVFITSRVSLSRDGSLPGAYESRDIKGLYVLVEPSGGKKCERCWMYDLSVGLIADEPEICGRCRDALDEINKA